MFYVTHRSEVQTEVMMEMAWKDKKTVVVPAVDPLNDKIKAVRIRSLKRDLAPKTFGVREPKTCADKYVTPKNIDLVIVPAIAFDVSGNRIGYGKGYYDCWLKHFPRRKRVGLAFDFQVVKKLPRNEKDLPVGKIITEKRAINVMPQNDQNERSQ